MKNANTSAKSGCCLQLLLARKYIFNTQGGAKLNLKLELEQNHILKTLQSTLHQLRKSSSTCPPVFALPKNLCQHRFVRCRRAGKRRCPLKNDPFVHVMDERSGTLENMAEGVAAPNLHPRCWWRTAVSIRSRLCRCLRPPTSSAGWVPSSRRTPRRHVPGANKPGQA